MREIYLDNSATTALCPGAVRAMHAMMEEYGNPSSLHRKGTAAALALRGARQTLGAALGERFLREGQLIFTSCGTEATALALLGAAHAKKRRTASTILTTDSEHPSVFENLKLLEEEGFRVVRVPTKGGVLDMDIVRAHCDRDLFMVTMMLVNNETGARYPVEEVFALARKANPEVVCHCDAVQGFLKVDFTARSLGADLITLSAHKIHGPKGVGALYVAPAILTAKKLAPFLRGGGQEFGLRSGTENTVGIAGFAAAVEQGVQTRGADIQAMRRILDAFTDALRDLDVRLNLPPVRAPHILSVTLPRIKSETMLHFLESRGIFVSSGSACASHAKHPSETLLAFGLSPKEAECTLRISISSQTEPADATAFAAALREGIDTLVRIK